MSFRLVVTLAALLCGCVHTRYLGQAAHGQLELLASARPIDEVLADPDTDPRTFALLREVDRVLAYVSDRGLEVKGNYARYVHLDRDAVVWMVTASRPLAFEAKTWWFPIVGSFPYLGWFERREALRHARALQRNGWDVAVRPVRAYSTGGWFDDPVLSSMLSTEDDALRYLTNVLIHELVHANVLVPSQSTFNESLATFVGDAMAQDYLRDRFGEGSAELAAYREDLAEDRRYGARLAQAYRELEALYASDAPAAGKKTRKRAILDAVKAELALLFPINNANLIGYATYNAGVDELAALFETCSRDWPSFLKAVRGLDGDDFPEDQLEDIDPVIRKLASGGCGS